MSVTSPDSSVVLSIVVGSSSSKSPRDDSTRANSAPGGRPNAVRHDEGPDEVDSRLHPRLEQVSMKFGILALIGLWWIYLGLRAERFERYAAMRRARGLPGQPILQRVIVLVVGSACVVYALTGWLL